MTYLTDAAVTEPIYLDYNATTPLLPEVIEAMTAALAGDGFGNPSSQHWAGRAAKALLDQGRADVAALLGVAPDEITFTAGATEAINQVIWSAGPGRVITTTVEHPAVFAALDNLGGREVQRVATARHGGVGVDDLLRCVDAGDKPALVCVMAANNETGILNPVAELVGPLRDRGVPFAVDAVQFTGKLPIDFRPDYLIATAHKFGGPKGIGALATRAGAPLRPLVAGGGQERGTRGGTEPVWSIAGFGAAARAVRAHLDEEAVRLRALRDRLEGALLAALPGSLVVGQAARRLPNTSSFILPEGAEADAVMRHLNRRGIAVSAGSACHAKSLRPSRVLLAAGLTPREALRALRISLGHRTTAAHIDALIDILPGICQAVEG